MQEMEIQWDGNIVKFAAENWKKRRLVTMSMILAWEARNKT
jgi:hypothetical protein